MLTLTYHQFLFVSGRKTIYMGWTDNTYYIKTTFTQITDAVSKTKQPPNIMKCHMTVTYQLAWEQQELDYNQMADYSRTTRLDEFVETSLKKQLPRHMCRDAWQDVCQQQTELDCKVLLPTIIHVHTFILELLSKTILGEQTMFL